MRAYLIRLSISVVVVLAASSPYLFQGDVRSMAAAPSHMAFDLGEWNFSPILHRVLISPLFALFLSGTTLSVAAIGRVYSFVATGVLAFNAVVAFAFNFHLYEG